MPDAPTRPDLDRVLAGLKDFQRATVDWAFRRMYVDPNPTHRFLVADEVGLGKTMVARGMVAKVLDHLWDDVERIDIVYVCSNQQIARQNVNRLRFDEAEYERVPRLTLLPRCTHGLREQKVNFVSMTPGTSLEPKSRGGRMEERVLLYCFLEKHWGLTGARPRHCFRLSAGAEKFARWVRSYRVWYDLDERIESEFRHALDRAEAKRLAASRPTLRAEAESLFEVIGRGTSVPRDVNQRRLDLIGELRAILARVCIEALEPDLVILDEFQRFRHLLDAESEEAALARALFSYVDDDTGEQCRTLLLSATPYRMYCLAGERAQLEDDHYEDFLATARFLLHDPDRTRSLENTLQRYRDALFRLSPSSVDEAVAVKRELEGHLRGVMCRTERLAATADRSGMLQERPCSVAVTADEALAYVELQTVAKAAEAGETLEFWKSAPYPLSLMDATGYKLKRELHAEAERERIDDDLAVALQRAQRALLPWHDIREYERVDPRNARLRWLLDDTIGRGLWRLLWLPPTLPYHAPGAPFDAVDAATVTKRLIFSSYRVTPRAVAAMVSYEAERCMIRSLSQPIRYDEPGRTRLTGLLRFTRSEGRMTGMPVLGLIYPSAALASVIDPLIGSDSQRPLTALLSAAEAAIERELGCLPAPAGDGPPDQAWYWAAPLLLDQAIAPEAVSTWFADPELESVWQDAVDEDAEGSAWADHVDLARRTVGNSEMLGRRPDDLVHVLALAALAGPGTVALRALSRVCGGAEAQRVHSVRLEAGRIAWRLMRLFDGPEVIALIRGMDQDEPYWQRVLEYAAAGNIQSVLDEWVHVLFESLGLGSAPPDRRAHEFADEMTTALGLRTTSLAAEELRVSRDGRLDIDVHRLRSHFAASFSTEKSEDERVGDRLARLRSAFNSPFWPFVLATTSVGQEGLDFHQYCHAVVHWNLPSNPVDLEQREGRVHRYKGHAVRKNVARSHATVASAPDPWGSMFECAQQSRQDGATDIVPFWVYEGNGAAGTHAVIERYVPAVPLSREVQRYQRLRESLALYRAVFGQARQEDLLRYLSDRIPQDTLREILEQLRVDLSPAEVPGVAPM